MRRLPTWGLPVVAAMLGLMAAGVLAAGLPAKAPPASPPAAPSAVAAPAPAAPSKKPAEPPAAVRAIRGRLTPPERVKEAFLIERSMELKVPLQVDPKTGAFEATGLRMGTYDLVVLAPWGRLEGVDMAPKVSDYDALIPPEYRTEDLGKPAEGSFSEDDAKAVRRILYEVKRYENKIRDLCLAGSADKAVALMELAMDAPFIGRQGDEITWRIELWYYEKNYDAWTTFRTRVLYRFRISKAVWATWGWQFEPALGGFNISADRKEPVTVEFAIPEKPVPEKGLVGTRPPPVEKGKYKEPPPPADAP